MVVNEAEKVAGYVHAVLLWQARVRWRHLLEFWKMPRLFCWSCMYCESDS